MRLNALTLSCAAALALAAAPSVRAQDVMRERCFSRLNCPLIDEISDRIERQQRQAFERARQAEERARRLEETRFAREDRARELTVRRREQQEEARERATRLADQRRDQAWIRQQDQAFRREQAALDRAAAARARE